jgi:hypothetical protein
MLLVFILCPLIRVNLCNSWTVFLSPYLPIAIGNRHFPLKGKGALNGLFSLFHVCSFNLIFFY